ncbi:hypothetical protein ACM66B_003400 [Microbotryomycetes sp. NB124-2]
MAPVVGPARIPWSTDVSYTENLCQQSLMLPQVDFDALWNREGTSDVARATAANNLVKLMFVPSTYTPNHQRSLLKNVQTLKLEYKGALASMLLGDNSAVVKSRHNWWTFVDSMMVSKGLYNEAAMMSIRNKIGERVAQVIDPAPAAPTGITKKHGKAREQHLPEAGPSTPRAGPNPERQQAQTTNASQTLKKASSSNNPPPYFPRRLATRLSKPASIPQIVQSGAGRARSDRRLAPEAIDTDLPCPPARPSVTWADDEAATGSGLARKKQKLSNPDKEAAASSDVGGWTSAELRALPSLASPPGKASPSHDSRPELRVRLPNLAALPADPPPVPPSPHRMCSARRDADVLVINDDPSAPLVAARPAAAREPPARPAVAQAQPPPLPPALNTPPVPLACAAPQSIDPLTECYKCGVALGQGAAGEEHLRRCLDGDAGATVLQCPICDAQLEHMAQLARERHVDACCNLAMSGASVASTSKTPMSTTRLHRIDSDTAAGSSKQVDPLASGTVGGRRDYADFVASELSVPRDDVTALALECQVCYQEFDRGDKLRRMSCYCVYHSECLGLYWTAKPGSFCPTHDR